MSYQYALRALIKAIPSDALTERPPFASVGRYEIWPCADAAVVLVYPSAIDKIEVMIRESTSKAHNEFLGTSEVGAYFQEDGTPVTWRPVVSIADAEKYIVHAADPVSSGPLGTVRPRFQKLSLFGWDVALPEPDDEALHDLRADLAAHNISSKHDVPRPEVKRRALSLLTRFREVLETAGREEEVQSFLSTYPELLYPDYITCHSKLPLGENYVTDYVVLVQGISGQEYVFVEIENPSKSVFVSKGHFSQDFSQAKNQLLTWSAWITENHQYLERRLPKLGRPVFHLIMGRSENWEGAGQRAILQAEFAGTERRFSTYDDVAERFEKIIETLMREEII